MKLTMALGGFLGFGIGLLLSWVQGSSWPSVVWRSSLAALLAGLLLRWWGRLWVASLKQSHQDRQSALAAVKKSESKPKPTPAK